MILKKKILTLIESHSLRKKIIDEKHVFSEYDLLIIICKYSKTYDQKIELLKQMIFETKDNNIKLKAQKYLLLQERILEEFMKDAVDTIFELYIENEYRDNEDHFLMRNYIDILNVINQHINECKEKATYKLLKRRIIDSNNAEYFSNELGECNMNNNKTIINITMYAHNDNDVFCIENELIIFPLFLNDYDIVSYFNDKYTKCYGVVLDSMKTSILSASVFVLPLDNEIIKQNNFMKSEDGIWNILYYHSYIDRTKVEKENLDSLPNYLILNYHNLISFMNHEKIKSRQ